ncbi:nucleoid-associated protein [Mesorhizobium sp. M0323]|uniref:nucleoid-associated protein n=1 Tax=Mesorhizobium sp. M0323 TaxID=2956938 RepID=UPI0033350F48
MSFFKPEELASLQINRMILHVVGGEGDFDPQPEMPEIEDEGFFIARIQDFASDSVHVFDEHSDTKATLQQLASDTMGFQDAGQTLARRFSNDHVGSSRDGAFFVFQIGCADNRTSFYSMIKYDYRQAMELYEDHGRNALRRIIQAFIQEKRAIQKCCLVRVTDGVVNDEVSAIDRMGKAPDLTDYFKSFLQVNRNRTDQELNRSLNEAIRSTLEFCKHHLPDGAAAALDLVREHLRGRENIDEESVREAIFVAAGRPENEEVQSEIEKVTNREMRRKRLSGVTFKPDPQILRRAPRRRIRTAEGVAIEFPGDQEQRAVVKTIEGRTTTITITTSQALVEDVTLPYKPRDQAGPVV